MTASHRPPLPQRHVLITGCSSGIGYECAWMLRRRGYPVIASARHEDDVRRLREEGFACVRLDLCDDGSIAAALEEVDALSGERLYALFNNGAYGQPGAVEDLTREVLRRQFETNVFGTHELTRRVIARMRRQGYGRLVFNSSVLGFVAMPFRGAYNASKFALEGLADTLRLELHGSGITVSLIEPGPIRSRFRHNALRAFEQHIDYRHSVFAETYERVLKRLRQPGDSSVFTLGPEAVGKKLIHALESRHPRIRYAVTFPTHLFHILRRCLPATTLDRLLRQAGRAENR